MLSHFNTIFKTRNLYLFFLSIIAIGLSVSKLMISLSEIGLFLVWLIDGNIKQKISTFFKNKAALVLSSIYILALFGLLYTNNFDYAVDDVRRKLPLLFFPIFVSSFQPISTKEFYLLFKIYIVGVMAATIWCYFVMLGGIDIVIVDKRDFSRFNSHIRFGLEICLAIFGSAYYLIREKLSSTRIIWATIIVWLTVFLFILNLFTGVIILFISSVFLLFIYALRTSNKKRKYLLGSIIILFISIGVAITYSTVNQFYDYENIVPITPLKMTDSGEPYVNEAVAPYSYSKENGYLVYKHIAWKELEKSWGKRSDIKFDGKDLRGQEIKHTIIRFITSQGKRKNKQAVEELSDVEIEAIQNGVANYKYIGMNGISRRLHKIIWEYNSHVDGVDPNGHSVIMRWVYWKTAYRIFKQNPILGVGTGDVQDAFDRQYEKDHSSLLPKYRLRAHNQYITYGVSFGVLGILLFAFFLIYPMIVTNAYKNYFYLAFYSIATLSMISEDTLETQVGITFFAFFNTIFLLKEKD